jgi:invasion protein IalB
MRLILAIAAAIGLAAGGLAVPAAAQDKPAAGPDIAPEPDKPDVTRHGDWFVGCQELEVDGGTVRACEMQQVLEEKSSGQAFIRISLIYPRGRNQPVMRIFTPLGVLLQKGMVMQIDQRDPITMPFTICIAKPPACVVEGVLQDGIVEAMKRGAGGTLKLTFAQNQEINAPFSLTGFTKSIGEIAPK